MATMTGRWGGVWRVAAVAAAVGCGGERERVDLGDGIERVQVDLPRGSLMVRTDAARTSAIAVVRGDGAIGGPKLVTEVRGAEAWLTLTCGVDPLCEADVDLDLPPGASVTANLGNGNLATFSLLGGEHDYHVERGVIAASFATEPEAGWFHVGRGEAQVDLPAGEYALDLDAPEGDVAVADRIGRGEGPTLVVAVERGDVTVGAMPDVR